MNADDEKGAEEARKTVILRTFPDEVDAEMAAALLKDEGIETLVSRDDPGRMGIRRSAKLLVLMPDLEHARALLDAMNM
jgi:hypothetical protein